MISATAPGKLILLGEYAVLDGAPALVAAVDRHARVHGTPCDDGWTVTAPEVSDQSHRFEVTAQGIRWRDDPLPLVDAVLAECQAELATVQTHDLQLSTTDFFHAGSKLGLGSSAALTVALVQALLDAQGRRPTRDELFDLADRAHRRFQGGRGSGVDVAASTCGGLLAYVREPRRLETVTWPSDLHGLPIWTGRATSTTRSLSRLSAWRQAAPAEAAQHFEQLCREAEAGTEAFRDGRVDDFLAGLVAFRRSLDQLGRRAGIAIVSEDHRWISQRADRLGVHYKPSGAGDGDFGVALARDPAALDTLAQEAREAGFRTPLPRSPWAKQRAIDS